MRVVQFRVFEAVEVGLGHFLIAVAHRLADHGNRHLAPLGHRGVGVPGKVGGNPEVQPYLLPQFRHGVIHLL